MSKNPIGVKHFANIGDAIAAMATLKSYHARTGRKIKFYQQLNVAASYYAGAVHPTLDDSGSGIQVMCNQGMFDMLKPLIVAQDYIEEMDVFKGQDINIDLDVIRGGMFVNMPNGALQAWLFLVYPDMAWDLSKSWMNIGDVDISNCGVLHRGLVMSMLPLENIENKVIVNFTQRYRNEEIHYYFLKNCQNQLLFAGTTTEHKVFCEKWELDIPRIHVNNFLELAFILKKAKFLISNQSFCWNVAEAMKTPRLLEYCQIAPNCQSFIGEHSYGYYRQAAVEYYFKLLMNKK